MDFFSRSKPNLIDNNTLYEIHNIIGGNNELSPVKDVKIMNEGLADFYSNYIEPNLFFIILAIIFLFFLYWRYESKISEDYQDIKSKKEKSKKKIKKYKQLEKKLLDNLIDTVENEKVLDKVENRNFVANFNPSIPVSAQNSYTNYLPNTESVMVDGNKINYRNYYNEQEPNYNYPSIIKNKLDRGDTYTGMFNEYNNSQDQNYPNPYGWEQNYNQSTYEAIEFATNRNRNNIEMLNHMVDNTNFELSKNIM